MKPTPTLEDLDAQAAQLRARVHATGSALAKDRAFTLHEISVALDFANVPANAANRTIALLSFLASLP